MDKSIHKYNRILGKGYSISCGKPFYGVVLYSFYWDTVTCEECLKEKNGDD